MNFRTEIKKETIEGKKGKTDFKIETVTKKHTAMIEFDAMVVSEKLYLKLLAQEIMDGKSGVADMVGVAVEIGEHLDDNEIVLQLDGEMVGLVYDD